MFFSGGVGRIIELYASGAGDDIVYVKEYQNISLMGVLRGRVVTLTASQSGVISIVQ
jgi:hypothetical protein